MKRNERVSEQRRERMADFESRLAALRDQEAASLCPEYAVLRKIDRALRRVAMSARASQSDAEGIYKARDLLNLIRHSWVPSILTPIEQNGPGLFDDDAEVEEKGGDL